MQHSNQIREDLFSDRGVDLLDVYTGPAGVLTGSARSLQEAAERAETLRLDQELESRKRELERKRQAAQAQVDMLNARMAFQEEELQAVIREQQLRNETLMQTRRDMARMRMADENGK